MDTTRADDTLPAVWPEGFLWGASTSPHQTEGNNLNSDWWHLEANMSSIDRSGDACDSYHRYEEEMRLLAEAGLTAYRFGVEWARIEPDEGHFSRAQLAHYQRMIDTARVLGLEPVVTLHHFSNPRWFTDDGGWTDDRAVERFARYVEFVAGILGDVRWICTLNEPNVLSMMTHLLATHVRPGAGVNAGAGGGADSEVPAGASELDNGVFPAPDEEIGRRLIRAHKAAVKVLRQRTSARIGWSVAVQALVAAPGAQREFQEVRRVWEDLYLEASRGDDYIGVQSYTSRIVDENGIAPQPDHPDNTLNGWPYRPDALGTAVRRAHEVTGLPVFVTENGIATADDARRIAYTEEALCHLHAAIADGIDVRGYLHWTSVDNFEWGDWGPTFGLIAVDRETFARTPKLSLAWLGSVARGARANP